MASSESLIMTLLEQVRCLEEERDKALELSTSLNEKLQVKEEQHEDEPSSKSSEEMSCKEMLETMVNDLEAIQLNEEQRQFNILELTKEKESEWDNGNSDSKMLELCKQYYGKMVAELQQDRNALQKKVEKLQNEVIEKDMKIAELQMSQTQTN